jgi:4,5-DOPA dioxygenase extradiol
LSHHIGNVIIKKKDEEKMRLPAIFIGHGSPMNAIEDNQFNRAWREISTLIPRPRLIIAISAHWVLRGTAITTMEKLRTIHDFYGFPEDLYQVEYPAPGAPEEAEKIAGMLKGLPVLMDTSWGLDHGTWSTLVHLYPQANIPVLQLSLDDTISREMMYEIGKQLSPLREEGVLIMGSGNIVHNLRMMKFNGDPYPWTVEFDAQVKEYIKEGSHEKLIDYTDIPSAALAHPTDEHYLPLLYTLGAAGDSQPSFYNVTYYAGSLSMTSVVWK